MEQPVFMLIWASRRINTKVNNSELAEISARAELLAIVKKMQGDKLTAAKSGNLSIRCEGGFIITPTGVAYDTLTDANLVFLNTQGQGREGELKPSSEWHFHCDIYKQKSEVGGVVHTHSNAATAIACTGQSIPAFHYMVALFGGNSVPCMPYATFATHELSVQVLKGLSQHSACLLQNHGVVVVESKLSTAYQRAVELESLAQQYLLAKQLGEVTLLTDKQMQEAKEAFGFYGQK